MWNPHNNAYLTKKDYLLNLLILATEKKIRNINLTFLCFEFGIKLYSYCVFLFLVCLVRPESLLIYLFVLSFCGFDFNNFTQILGTSRFFLFFWGASKDSLTKNFSQRMRDLERELFSHCHFNKIHKFPDIIEILWWLSIANGFQYSKVHLTISKIL